MNADQIRSLQPELAALLDGFQDCFQTKPTFAHWGTYLWGLMTDLKRKSIEPIALAAGVPVRTLQEFLSQLVWDDQRVRTKLQLRVADEHASPHALGVLDASPSRNSPTNSAEEAYFFLFFIFFLYTGPAGSTHGVFTFPALAFRNRSEVVTRPLPSKRVRIQ